MSSFKSGGITLHVDRDSWPGMASKIVGTSHLMMFGGKMIRIFHVKGGVDMQHAHTYLGIVKEFEFDGVGNVRGGTPKTLHIVTKPPILLMTTNETLGGDESETELYSPCIPRFLFATTIKIPVEYGTDVKIVGILLRDSVLRRAHKLVFRFNGMSYSCLGTSRVVAPTTPTSRVTNESTTTTITTPTKESVVVARKKDIVMETPHRACPGVSRPLDTPTRSDVRSLMAALSPFADTP